MKILLLVAFILSSHASEKYTADIFDVDGKEKVFSFTGQRIYTKETMNYETTFKDQVGEIVATEKALINKGQIVKYEVERIKSQEKGLVEGKDGQIFFTYTEKGKTTTAKEPLKETTLISATLVPHLEANLNQLFDKKEVPFRYAIWFRKEVLAFKFVYDKEEAGNVIIKMVPSNLLYRSLSSPLYFTVEKSTKKLLSIKGRTLPKVQKDGAFRDFDALLKYNY